MSTVREEINATQGALPVTVAEAEGDRRGTVVVLHQAGGMRPQITTWLERLAGGGYDALAPHLFHRRGVDAIDPRAQFAGDMVRFDQWLPDDDELRADLEAVLAHVRERGTAAAGIGMVGFSYGGRAAFLAAVEFDLGACISLYANGIAHRSFTGNPNLGTLAHRPLRSPWLGLFGEEDPLIGLDELQELRACLDGQDVPHELVTYRGAAHAFDVDAPAPGRPPTFAPEAAADAQARVLSFLAAHLRRA
jgi:carboxymethylenebutenolidase